MSSRRTVHIPIVQPGGPGGVGSGEDRLIEVYTQLDAFDPLTKHEEEESRRSDEKARDKDWDRVAAPLRKVGLYQAGCAAASAVRKLGLRRPLTALYQQISRLAWIDGQRLHPASAHGPTEGRSAELGLALVLLMGASGSRQRQVIATGALGGQPRGALEDDVEVLPVASLPEKLEIVLTLALHGALPGLGQGRELLFFTPRQFQTGGDWREVRSLDAVELLRQQGVQVVPVARLSEAAAALNARRTRHLLADRIAAAVAGLLVLAGGVGMAWSSVQERAIPMAFIPGGGAASEAEPFQACFTADGGFYPVPLGRDGVGYDIPAGETLGWRVRVGRPTEELQGMASWLAPDAYFVAQVLVSERSRAKVIVPQESGARLLTVPPGGTWEWGWKLNDLIESNGLVLLARADAPFDPDLLRKEILERFPNAAGSAVDGAGLDVTAAVNFVAAQAPGAAKFIVQTTEGSVRCSP
jgi:hypothetical protein